MNTLVRFQVTQQTETLGTLFADVSFFVCVCLLLIGQRAGHLMTRGNLSVPHHLEVAVIVAPPHVFMEKVLGF